MLRGIRRACFAEAFYELLILQFIEVVKFFHLLSETSPGLLPAPYFSPPYFFPSTRFAFTAAKQFSVGPRFGRCIIPELLVRQAIQIASEGPTIRLLSAQRHTISGLILAIVQLSGVFHRMTPLTLAMTWTAGCCHQGSRRIDPGGDRKCSRISVR